MPPNSPAAYPAALMVSAAFGGGHRQASAAVAQALAARLEGRIQLDEVDAVDMLSPLERALIVGVYDFWLRHWPAAYHAFYRWTDSANEPVAVLNTFNWLGQAGFRHELRQRQPGLVVNTFPTTVALADTVRRRQRLDFLNVLVLTDYRVHHHWARPQADLILLPTEATRQEMLAWGMDPGRLAVTGLPVSAEVTRLSGLDASRRQAEMLQALGWTEMPEAPIILVSGGSGVYRGFDEVIGTLGNLGTRTEVLVVAGPKAPCTEMVGGARVHHLGYRQDFPVLLAGAALLIGKAGGMTVAEATALGIPLIVYQPIPGQEEHNARHLLEQGAALWPRTRAELRRAALNLLDPGVRAQMAQSSRVLGVPDAASRAAEVLLTRLGWEA